MSVVFIRLAFSPVITGGECKRSHPYSRLTEKMDDLPEPIKTELMPRLDFLVSEYVDKDEVSRDTTELATFTLCHVYADCVIGIHLVKIADIGLEIILHALSPQDAS